jgi:adenine-specific DNA methylase
MSDFVEVMPWADSSGGFSQGVEWVSKVVSHLCHAEAVSPSPTVECASAVSQKHAGLDLIVTDPPYYDAIGYGVVMDFFSVWLTRTVGGCVDSLTSDFSAFNKPKWDHVVQDGELVDDAARFDGDKAKSKANYEGGMARAFRAAHEALSDAGRIVIVFAHNCTLGEIGL